MKIAFDINGVLRDTFGKAEQVYQKFYIDDYVREEGEEEFEFKLNFPMTSYTLSDHFIFPKEEDLYDFLYVEYPMQIFGHAPSPSGNTFNILNEIYEELRDNHEILIVSDEIQKSKPATLFFLSKYGCLVEKILFFSKITENNMWSECDVLVTANPNLIQNKPSDKILVKYETEYNTNVDSEYTIKNIEDFKSLYEKLKLKEND